MVAEYGSSIVNAMINKGETDNSQGLEHHDIKGRHRRQMVEWMREVLQVFKSPVDIFYQGVAIMDMYFARKQKPLKLDELHEIGVTSIFLASKYSELEPLTLDLMHEKAAHGKISKQDILRREMDILKTL